MSVVWLFLVVPWVCLQFVIVVFPDHTHLLFYRRCIQSTYIKILVSCEFWEFTFHYFFQDRFYTWDFNLGICRVEHKNPVLSSKTGAENLVFV